MARNVQMQFLRGVLANIPTLAAGELYYATDTKAMYVGPTPQAIGGGVQTVTVSLTAAQLLALSTTSIQIVAAPGAGNYILPIAYSLEYIYGGTAYHTPATTNNAFFGWSGSTINSVNSPIAFTGWGVFIENTFSCFAFGTVGNAANVGITTASSINTAIVFGVPNALTLGNGTLKVTLMYTIQKS